MKFKSYLRVSWKLLKITIQSCLCEVMSTVWDAEVRSPRTEGNDKELGWSRRKITMQSISFDTGIHRS